MCKEFTLKSLFVPAVAVLFSVSMNSHSIAAKCDILESEKALSEIGFDPGPVDGVWDDAAVHAAGVFQDSIGLPVSGDLDAETCWRLQNSPIVDAAFAGDLSTIEAMLAAGANPDHQRDDGMTALMGASDFAGYLEIVEALLAAGADPNVQSYENETALFLAAQAGHTKIVKALLAAGADPTLKRNDGMTALVPARSGGHKAVVNALLTATADWERQEVCKLQEALTGLGYALGTIDGVAGKRTRASIASFAKDAEMPKSASTEAVTMAVLDRYKSFRETSPDSIDTDSIQREMAQSCK